MAERVAVCVTTYRRPRGLERLLRALGTLTFAGRAPEVEVIVVDNDPAEGAARAVCARLAPQLPHRLRYAPEPRRGIAQARNRALALALEDADHVAFLDDDETPTPGWLDALLAARAAYGADGVVGPVPCRFEAPAPAWVERGGFFARRRHPTGTPMTRERLADCGTGNLLLWGDALRATGLRFDERLALTGGEDTDFFIRFVAAGMTLVWADDAVAEEWVPASRVRIGWILQREFRGASTWSRCERDLLRSPLAPRAARGGARIAQGVLLLALAPAGLHRLVHALRYLCRGAGSLAGLAGVGYQEYRVTHGH